MSLFLKVLRCEDRNLRLVLDDKNDCHGVAAKWTREATRLAGHQCPPPSPGPRRNLRWPIKVMSMYLNVSLGALLRAELCAMKLKSKRSISFPEDGQTPPAWLTLTVTLMVCYATIVAFGLLRALDL